jgi:hypothetical protein
LQGAVIADASALADEAGAVAQMLMHAAPEEEAGAPEGQEEVAGAPKEAEEATTPELPVVFVNMGFARLDRSRGNGTLNIWDLGRDCSDVVASEDEQVSRGNMHAVEASAPT